VTTAATVLDGLRVDVTTVVAITVGVTGAVLETCSALLAESVSEPLDVGAGVSSDLGVASTVVVRVKVLVSVSLDTTILLYPTVVVTAGKANETVTVEVGSTILQEQAVASPTSAAILLGFFEVVSSASTADVVPLAMTD
jgi:hypothetical protein